MERARGRAGPRQPELTGLDRYLTRTGDLTIVVPRTPVASISVVTVPSPFAVPRTVSTKTGFPRGAVWTTGGKAQVERRPQAA